MFWIMSFVKLVAQTARLAQKCIKHRPFFLPKLFLGVLKKKTPPKKAGVIWMAGVSCVVVEVADKGVFIQLPGP